MAEEEIIAKRYARGLAEYAVEQGGMNEVRHDLKVVAGLLDPRTGSTYVPELASFLNSPSRSADDKKKALASMMEKAGVSVTVTDFLGVLIDRGRIGLLPKIANAFGVASEELTGEHTAVVHTARRLTVEQEHRLQSALAAAYGGRVHIRQQVEPGLLAGAKVMVGDQTFDGSVLGKLEALRRRLTTGDVFLAEPETPDAAS